MFEQATADFARFGTQVYTEACWHHFVEMGKFIWITLHRDAVFWEPG
jgi:hypothetical protein